MLKLILASQSPRRRQLIELLGHPFHWIAADVDEGSITHPDPAVNVIKTAELKATAIAKQLHHKVSKEKKLIVAADTTVALEGHMLGKPVDETEAQQMLQALRNRTHQVYTGLIVIDPATGQKISEVSTAVVHMRDYTGQEIADYIASGDPMDKAGAYAIQHAEFRPVAHFDGCYMGIMGLSICHLIQLLHRFGVTIAADLTAVKMNHHGYHCPIYDQILSLFPGNRTEASNNRLT